MSTLLLSRIQFAITITFHILFPAFSIGLATYAVIVEGLWLKTRNKVFYQSLRFWGKVLALTFGMGIISGLAMAFQMGSNWAGFSAQVGPVLGVLFTLETLTAFFIEATFLGVMLFGWHLVPRWLHYLATIMVFVGVSVSAFWIMAANSWMQTPAGVLYQHHAFQVTSWWQVIFNHSTVLRYTHMLLASYLATAMVIAAVGAYRTLKFSKRAFGPFNLKLALFAIAIIMPLQILMGDEVGLNVHEYQPIKTAAIEGAWQTTPGTPLLLLADINQQQQKNNWQIGIPHGAALINLHQWNGAIQGLRSVKPEYQPYVVLTFYSFRIMVAAGFIMLFVALFGLYLKLKNKLYDNKLFLKFLTLLAPTGFIALVTGWYTAESGRQPWVVYNLIATSSAVSKVSAQRVLLGFVIILLVYGLLFGCCYMSYFIHTIRKGPVVKPRKYLRRPA